MGMKTCPERKRKVLKANKGLLEADLVYNWASFASFSQIAERQLGSVECRCWQCNGQLLTTPRCFLVILSQFCRN